MLEFNCARVYVGEYDNGQNNEYFDIIHCGYKVLSGNVAIKKLRPLPIHGYDGNGYVKTYFLDTLVLYPVTDTSIISVNNGQGVYSIKLIKHQGNNLSTMYKMRL
jgi:archaellum component FlaF (FlaF/FlaG flagellin family)